MKNISKILILFSMILVASCSNDDDNTITNDGDQTIATYLASDADYSVLVDALQRAGLTAALNASGSTTVFAPNNDAFTEFLEANDFASLDDIPEEVLSNVLLNHVINGEFVATDFTTGYIRTNATASSGLNLSAFVNASDGVVINGTSTVVEADIEVSNGVVHGVNGVISLPNIATLANVNPNFSSLTTALDAASLTVAVSDPTANLTVFAPTNDAFDTFLSDNGFGSLGDVPLPALQQTLLNHVLAETNASTDFTTSYTTTLATFGDTDDNISLYINTDAGVVLNGNSTVVAADVVATNGIIHAVDTVIALPTVVTFATADPTFGTLVDALTRPDQSDFVGTLSTPLGTDPAPFTVFAPTNDAFGDLLTELGVGALADIDGPTLTAALNLHVIAGANVRAEDLTNGPVTTLGGDVTIDADAATITDANGRVSTIIVTNVQASNGVVHAIDTVLLPEL